MPESIQVVTLQYVRVEDPFTLADHTATVQRDLLGIARLWAKLAEGTNGAWLSVPVNPAGRATLSAVAGRIHSLMPTQTAGEWELVTPIELADSTPCRIRLIGVPETEQWVSESLRHQPAA